MNKKELKEIKKEKLLELLLERINMHYAGAGWYSKEKEKSIPTYKAIQSAILKRMR